MEHASQIWNRLNSYRFSGIAQNCSSQQLRRLQNKPMMFQSLKYEMTIHRPPPLSSEQKCTCHGCHMASKNGLRIQPQLRKDLIDTGLWALEHALKHHSLPTKDLEPRLPIVSYSACRSGKRKISNPLNSWWKLKQHPNQKSVFFCRMRTRSEAWPWINHPFNANRWHQLVKALVSVNVELHKFIVFGITAD